MPLIRQNFSVAAGDDIEISLDINPDTVSLVGTDLTFRVYAQQSAVPVGDPVLTKNLDDGLQITDPDYGEVLIELAPADTIDLDPGNYVFEITTYDPEGQRTTVTHGIMSVTRTEIRRSFDHMAALEILPDVTSIKTRYPEFASADDAAIAFAIEEASYLVDDTWLERDRLPAVSAAAAHLLSSAAASAGVDGRDVVSETIGPISVTYAAVVASAAAAMSSMDSTTYGKLYASLLRKNFGGPFTVV